MLILTLWGGYEEEMSGSYKVLRTVRVTQSFDVSCSSECAQFIHYRNMGSLLCAPCSCVMENCADEVAMLVVWLGRKPLGTKYK